MKKLLLFLLVLAVPQFVSAADIYFAATSAGSNNGTSCANAYAYTDGTHGINVSGNWSAGNTLHICGTITASAGASGLIQAQNSGSSGNPITVKFETGAILTATYWGGNGAIFCSGQNYITVDGGTNGIIQATANGTGLANQANGDGILFSSCSNVEIKNLTISNIYVHTCNTSNISSCTDTSGLSTCDICMNALSSNTNILIHNNVFHDANSCISLPFEGTVSNVQLYNNTLSQCSFEINVGDGNANETLNNLYIYGNQLSNNGNWNTSSDTFHNDGIFVFIANGGVSPSPGSTINGMWIYNNTVSGSFGVCCTTGMIYLQSWESVAGFTNSYVFNNVMYSTGTVAPFDGEYYDEGQSGTIVTNNTMIAPSNATPLYTGHVSESGGAIPGETNTVENNIYNGGAPQYNITPSASVATSNYNDYYGWGTSLAGVSGTYWTTLSAWQSSGNGQDENSITTNPVLSVTYIPGVALAGKNLYSVCNGQPNPGLGALCFDASGATRPSSGAWQMGAYNESGVPTVPTPTISPASGSYTSPQTVTITCPAGAACYYTQNGSTPTCSSTPYTSPFSQTVPGTVEAIGCETGYTNSNVATANYVLSGGVTITGSTQILGSVSIQ